MLDDPADGIAVRGYENRLVAFQRGDDLRFIIR
jgi:hypothetical protein